MPFLMIIIVVCIFFKFYLLLFFKFRIVKLDRRIGNCTVLACNKWIDIFRSCEISLGMTGDAANDVFSAWNKLASDAFNRRSLSVHQSASITPTFHPRRTNSLIGGIHGKTVKTPVQLIPLERARALTSAKSMSRNEEFLTTIRSTVGSAPSEESLASSVFNNTEEFRPDITRPINLDESTSLCCSYPSGLSYRINVPPYSPHADFSEKPTCLDGKNQPESSVKDKQSDMEAEVGPDDVRTGIQNYVDKAFNTRDHPLGVLMNRIEMVYMLSYGGIGASKFLLPHAIAETHSIIQRIHGIVRY